jgi:thiamine biosynthesis lipoprotein
VCEEVRFDALGSTCHLLGVGLDRGRLEEGAAWVVEMHRRFSRFLPDSELSVFNAQAGREVEVSSELEAMLRAAVDAWWASGGLVNACVLEAMLAIGYTRPLREGPTAPDPVTAVAPLPPLPEVLRVRPGRGLLQAGTGVDLGGVAKGWMADVLAAELGDNCLVNLGGDLFARGGGPSGDGWPVALGGVTVLLQDQGAATSSTRRRRWDGNGRTVHHLIDPRTGRPAETDLVEVSVVAESAFQAEVWAKAALIVGSQDAPAHLAANALGWWIR